VEAGHPRPLADLPVRPVIPFRFRKKRFFFASVFDLRPIFAKRWLIRFAKNVFLSPFGFEPQKQPLRTDLSSMMLIRAK
jgi:hypothetical protein